MQVLVADVPESDRLAPGSAVEFTFRWMESGLWEGSDCRVDIAEATDRP